MEPQYINCFCKVTSPFCFIHFGQLIFGDELLDPEVIFIVVVFYFSWGVEVLRIEFREDIIFESSWRYVSVFKRF